MAAAPYRFFDERTAEIFRAIAACVVPSEPGSPGADSDHALALADQAIAARPEGDRALLTKFLRAVDLLPRMRFGRSFRALDPERRARVLRFLERNRAVPKLRVGFFGVKTYALLGYYGSRETFDELGYPGPRLDAPFYRAVDGAPAP